MPPRPSAEPSHASTPFRFVSTWTVQAPPARVWEVLADAETWPAWWPGVTTARTIHTGDPDGLGTRVALTVRSPIGYTLRFAIELVDTARPRHARMLVSGDLHGTGEWTARADGEDTRMTFTWHVGSPRWLVRASRPLAPAAHGIVMAAGERRLRAQLRSRL